ncbi:MAG: hypothetical protein J6Y98_08525 [Bacteroidales bacterium]|nr:hypothetical protein [Bacteroidales bacterium]
MKKIILIAVLLLPIMVLAQHNRQRLVQPDYDSYNLRFWPSQMTVVQKYNQGSDINFQETYLFDSVGNLTEYRKQGFGGERVTHYPLTLEDVSRNKLYVFDYDGDVLEIRQFNLKGDLYSSTHCIYAVGGNLTQSIEYTYHADSGFVTRRTVSYYDKRERLVAVEQYTADELLLWSEKRKYDRRGNLVKRTQTFFNDNEKETTVENRKYTFDSHGNWTQCHYSLNGIVMYTIERKIVYYGE